MAYYSVEDAPKSSNELQNSQIAPSPTSQTLDPTDQYNQASQAAADAAQADADAQAAVASIEDLYQYLDDLPEAASGWNSYCTEYLDFYLTLAERNAETAHEANLAAQESWEAYQANPTQENFDQLQADSLAAQNAAAAAEYDAKMANTAVTTIINRKTLEWNDTGEVIVFTEAVATDVTNEMAYLCAQAEEQGMDQEIVDQMNAQLEIANAAREDMTTVLNDGYADLLDDPPGSRSIRTMWEMGKAVWKDVPLIFTSYTETLVLYQQGLLLGPGQEAIDQAAASVASIQAQIDSAEALGLDTTELEADLADAQEDLNNATTAYNNALSLDPTSQNLDEINDQLSIAEQASSDAQDAANKATITYGDEMTEAANDAIETINQSIADAQAACDAIDELATHFDPPPAALVADQTAAHADLATAQDALVQAQIAQSSLDPYTQDPDEIAAATALVAAMQTQAERASAAAADAEELATDAAAQTGDYVQLDNGEYVILPSSMGLPATYMYDPTIPSYNEALYDSNGNQLTYNDCYNDQDQIVYTKQGNQLVPLTVDGETVTGADILMNYNEDDQMLAWVNQSDAELEQATAACEAMQAQVDSLEACGLETDDIQVKLDAANEQLVVVQQRNASIHQQYDAYLSNEDPSKNAGYCNNVHSDLNVEGGSFYNIMHYDQPPATQIYKDEMQAAATDATDQVNQAVISTKAAYDAIDAEVKEAERLGLPTDDLIAERTRAYNDYQTALADQTKIAEDQTGFNPNTQDIDQINSNTALLQDMQAQAASATSAAEDATAAAQSAQTTYNAELASMDGLAKGLNDQIQGQVTDAEAMLDQMNEELASAQAMGLDTTQIQEDINQATLALAELEATAAQANADYAAYQADPMGVGLKPLQEDAKSAQESYDQINAAYIDATNTYNTEVAQLNQDALDAANQAASDVAAAQASVDSINELIALEETEKGLEDDPRLDADLAAATEAEERAEAANAQAQADYQAFLENPSVANMQKIQADAAAADQAAADAQAAADHAQHDYETVDQYIAMQDITATYSECEESYNEMTELYEQAEQDLEQGLITQGQFDNINAQYQTAQQNWIKAQKDLANATTVYNASDTPDLEQLTAIDEDIQALNSTMASELQIMQLSLEAAEETGTLNQLQAEIEAMALMSLLALLYQTNPNFETTNPTLDAWINIKLTMLGENEELQGTEVDAWIDQSQTTPLSSAQMEKFANELIAAKQADPTAFAQQVAMPKGDDGFYLFCVGVLAISYAAAGIDTNITENLMGAVGSDHIGMYCYMATEMTYYLSTQTVSAGGILTPGDLELIQDSLNFDASGQPAMYAFFWGPKADPSTPITYDPAQASPTGLGFNAQMDALIAEESYNEENNIDNPPPETQYYVSQTSSTFSQYLYGTSEDSVVHQSNHHYSQPSSEPHSPSPHSSTHVAPRPTLIFETDSAKPSEEDDKKSDETNYDEYYNYLYYLSLESNTYNTATKA